MGRKAIPLYTILAVEKVLLKHTDWSTRAGLSYQDVLSRLSKDYGIDVSKNTVLNCVTAIETWQKDYPGSDAYRIKIENMNPVTTKKFGNEKQLVFVERDENLPLMVEHFIRYLESLSADDKNKDIEKLLLSRLDEKAQNKILAKVEGQKASEVMPGLSGLMRNIQKLEDAINQREYIFIGYSSAGDRKQVKGPDRTKPYLPIAVFFDGEHYYLSAKQRGAKGSFYRKPSGRKGYKGTVASPAIFRIDRIKFLESAGRATGITEEKFTEWREASERTMRAGLDGLFSGGVAKIEIACRDEKAKTYILNAIRGNPEFRDGKMDNYFFVASLDGFERWLPKWIHAVEVKSVRLGSDNKNGSWDFAEDNIASSVVDQVIDGIMGSKNGKGYLSRKSNE